MYSRNRGECLITTSNGPPHALIIVSAARSSRSHRLMSLLDPRSPYAAKLFAREVILKTASAVALLPFTAFKIKLYTCLKGVG
jgi:hypothetical protein